MGTRPSRFVIIALTMVFCGPLWAQDSGGDGSAENSFQIANPNNLVELGQHPEDWDKYFILTIDLNMNLAKPNYFPSFSVKYKSESFIG